MKTCVRVTCGTRELSCLRLAPAVSRYSRRVISGAHAIIYTTDADADRAFLKDVLGLRHVDVGGGWLIFSLPPSEVAVHPWERNDRHELFFLVKDVEAFIAKMRSRTVPCGPIQEQDWGRLTQVTLPGGGTIENSQCSISLSTTTLSSSGNDLTLTVPLTFTPAFGTPAGLLTTLQAR